MIDTKELRIGNYILYKGSKAKISGISLKHILAYTFYKEAKTPTSTENVSLNVEDCTPIPLAEELLLKCGMNECNDDAIVRYIYCNGKFKMSIVIHGLKKYIVHIHNLENGEQICGKEILYLHQLQNIYFDLTGNELEVSL